MAAFQGMDPEHGGATPAEVARLIDAPETLRTVGENVVAQLGKMSKPVFLLSGLCMLSTRWSRARVVATYSRRTCSSSSRASSC